MMSAVCAVSAHSLHSPLSHRIARPSSPSSPAPSARVDRIRQHFDQQRQQWEDQVTARCSRVWKHPDTEPKQSPTADNSDTDSTDSEKENQDTCNAIQTIPALRLVSSDHVSKKTGVTWTVTYDIRDFFKEGSVEVHCDPEGIVVTACFDSDSGSGSLKKRKSGAPPKIYKETFLIASVDHSSLRVKSKPNGLMKITVSSKALVRNTSKRLKAS